MVGVLVRQIPTERRRTGDGQARYPSVKPGGDRYRYEVKNEETEFIACYVVEPADQQQDNNTDEIDQGAIGHGLIFLHRDVPVNPLSWPNMGLAIVKSV